MSLCLGLGSRGRPDRAEISATALAVRPVRVSGGRRHCTDQITSFVSVYDVASVRVAVAVAVAVAVPVLRYGVVSCSQKQHCKCNS
jgi:hypothetical protein